jgi:AraC-like DNA-binding protein
MKIPDIKFSPKNNKNMGIEIIELSDIYNRLDNEEISFSTKPHRIQFHSLLYFTQGHGTHFIDFITYTIQPGSVVFVKKNQIHAFDLINKPQGKLIVFTDEFLDSISSAMKRTVFSPNHLLVSYSPSFTLTDNLIITFSTLLTEIEKELLLESPNLAFIHLIFSASLTKLVNARPKSYELNLSEPRAKKFNQFIQLLEQNFTTTRDAISYAGMLNMTYKSLNQICKLASKQTTKQLIDAHTILEAKRKLAIEGIRIQQLADDLGFDEVTNFVKYFKKNTLMTPSQFKKYSKG